jgi:hypothetical protein
MVNILYTRKNTEFFLLLFFFLHLLTCVYIACANPSHPQAPSSRQNLFCPLLRFCWRENLSNSKKDIVFLIIWDEDSYTERRLVLLPCTCVLQTTLFHFYQTSLLLPGPLTVVPSASLRLLYLLLYSEHINHIQVLGFLLFPYSSDVFSWCVRIFKLTEITISKD